MPTKRTGGTRHPNVMSLGDLSRYLPGVTQGDIIEHIDSIPHRAIGNTLLFSKAAIDDWLHGASYTPGGKAPAEPQHIPAPRDGLTQHDRQALRQLTDAILLTLNKPE